MTQPRRSDELLGRDEWCTTFGMRTMGTAKRGQHQSCLSLFSFRDAEALDAVHEGASVSSRQRHVATDGEGGVASAST